MRDYAQSLPMALLRAREAVMARFRPILREHGLTEQQWRILRALGAGEGLEATGLSEATLISMPSLTRILRGMEGAGLIRREGVAGDSRRKRVRLAPEGKALLHAVGPISEREYAEIADALGPARLDALYGLLAEVATAGDGALQEEEG